MKDPVRSRASESVIKDSEIKSITEVQEINQQHVQTSNAQENILFQEQLNDFPDAYSRNYEEYKLVVGKRQQKISESETIQIVLVGE